MDRIRGDLRQAARSLWRSPGFGAPAILIRAVAAAAHARRWW